MTYIKKAIRHRARQAGYKRIETPIFENIEVFERGIGEHTDAVEKELFLVSSKQSDEKEPKYALRPETTAATCRAYIEHGMSQWPQPVELYSFGPNFRHDRPQKGRYRQFNQFTFEVIGLKDPSLDAQLILVLTKILKDLRIMDRPDGDWKDEINNDFQRDDIFVSQANSFLDAIEGQPSISCTIDEAKHTLNCQMALLEEAKQASQWQNVNKSECLIYERKNS